MKRVEMIEWLINDDLNDWHHIDKVDEYLASILREGFVGYANQTDEQLRQEIVWRQE